MTDVIRQIVVPEDTHWYYRDGRPCLSVPLKKPVKEKDGTVRTTTEPTLRHAREMNLLVGITRICGMVVNYGLQNWLIGKALEFGYRFPQTLFTTEQLAAGGYGILSDEKCLKSLAEEWEKFSEKAALRGTAMHEGIEKILFLGEKVEDKACHVASAQITEMVAKDGFRLLQHEHSVVSPKRGMGGKLDAVAGDEQPRAIYDWKTVEKPRPPYDREIWQVGGYGMLMEDNGEKIDMIRLVYILQSTGEIVGVHNLSNDERERSKELLPVLMEEFVLVCNSGKKKGDEGWFDPRVTK